MKNKLIAITIVLLAVFSCDFLNIYGDEIPPVITASDLEINTSDASWWSDPVTANDIEEGNLTGDIIATYFEIDGTTPLADLAAARIHLYSGLSVIARYNVEDSFGNQAVEVEVTLTSIDNTRPTFDGVSNAQVYSSTLDTWEPPVTAFDNKDGDITDQVVITYFKINGTTQLADLEAARLELDSGLNIKVNYNVTDSTGNEAWEESNSFLAVDDSPPVITASDENVNTSDASTWDHTVTAIDNVDGDVTGDIIISYFESNGITPLADLADARAELEAGLDVIIKYNVSDNLNNAAELIVTLTSIDNTIPVITASNESIDSEDGFAWIDSATALDNKDGDISVIIVPSYYEADGVTVISSLFLTQLELTAGRDVVVKYNVVDAAGNPAVEVSVTITSTDTLSPIIIAVNEDVYTNSAGFWTDSATAFDNADGDITGNIVITYFKSDGLSPLTDLSFVLSELQAGRNVVVKYNVSDVAGNAATEVTITLTAIDNTIPLIFASNQDVVAGEASSWEDDVSAFDSVDGEITDDVIASYFKADGITPLADLAAVQADLVSGLMVVIKYNVSDSSGNIANEVIITLSAGTNIIPVITTSDEDVDTNDADTWIDSATAFDNVDGDITWKIVTTYFEANGTTPLLDLAAARAELYSGLNVVVKYNASDDGGNAALEVIITLTAIDNTIPIITATDQDVNTNDAGIWIPTATASDNVDGDISGSIIMTYFKADGTTPLADITAARAELFAGFDVVVKFDVSDASGNMANQESITVTSIDNTIPVITAINQVVDSEDASSWIDIATASDVVDGDISNDIVITYFEADGITPLADLVAVRSTLLYGGIVVVRYNVLDISGNAADEVEITLTPLDNTSPVITASDRDIDTEDAGAFTDSATAFDNFDGDISGDIVASYYKADGITPLASLSEAISELALGLDVVVKYNVSDSYANNATEVIITITAVDTVAPVITASNVDVFTNDASIYVCSVSAADNIDGDITLNVTHSYFEADGVTPLADLSFARSELSLGRNIVIKFNVTDSSGNVAEEVVVTVTAIDNTTPVIYASNEDVNTEDAFAWIGSPTSFDNVDGEISGSIIAAYYKADGITQLLDLAAARIDLAAGLNVVVKYNVTDSSNNNAAQVIITLTAIDNTIPIIDAVDENVNTEDANIWENHATATDNHDGDISNLLDVLYFKADGITSLLDLSAARNELSLGQNIIIKYAVTDTIGNEAVEVEVTIYAIDHVIPVITAFDEDVLTEDVALWTESVLAMDNIDGDISGNIVTTYFEIDGTTPILDFEAVRDHLFSGNFVIIKYNVSDSSSNDALELVITITSTDNTPPIIVATDNTVQTENALTWTPEYTVSDNFDGDITDRTDLQFFESDGVTIIPTLEEARQMLYAANDIKVMLTVTDNAGNTEVVFSITAIDNTPPVIAATDQIVFTNEMETWIDTVTSADNKDGDVTSTLISLYYKADGVTQLNTIEEVRNELFNGRNVVAKYESSDYAGNTSYKEILITAVDNTPPVILVDDMIISSQDFEGFEVNVPIITDNISVNNTWYVQYYLIDGVTEITEAVARDKIALANNIIVIYSAYDESFNLATFTLEIEVTDDTAPIILVTEGVRTLSDGDVSVSSVVVTVLEPSLSVLEYSLNGNPFVEMNVGETIGLEGIYIVRAVDTFGNTSTFEFIIDPNAPLFLVVSNGVEVYTNGYVNTPFVMNATATSLDTISYSIDGSPFELVLSGSSYSANGEYVFRAVNMAGVEVFFTIVIDTEAPTFDDISDLTIEAGLNNIDFIGYIVNENDNCNSELIKTIVSSNVDYDTPGTYLVSVKVMDGANNETIKDFTVEVVDTTAPVFDHITNIVIEAGSEAIDFVGLINNEKDNSDTYLTKSLVSSNVDYGVAGEYTVTVKVTDESMNETLKTFSVFVEDTIAPTYDDIEDQIIEANSNIIDFTTYITSISDNSSSTLTSIVVFSDVASDVVGEYTVTVKVVDASLNETEKTFLVTIVDTIAPTFNDIQDITIESGSNVIDFIDYIVNRNDNSNSVLTPLVYVNEVDYDTPGEYLVTVTLTDESLNQTQKTFTVLVTDTVAPTFDDIPERTINVHEVSMDWTTLVEGLVDNSDTDIILEIISDSIEYHILGEYVVVVRATDSSGNFTEKSIQVEVVDVDEPEYEMLRESISVTQGFSIDLDDVVFVIDNYDGNLSGNVEFLEDYDFSEPGTYNVVLVVKDSSDNQIEIPFVVIVTPNNFPIILGGSIVLASIVIFFLFKGFRKR